MAIAEEPVDLSFVRDLDLHYDGEPYRLGDYDLRNAAVICNSILGDGGDQVILGPTSVSAMLLGSIICAFALINTGLQSQSEAMHKMLKKGDKVLLDGKRGEFVEVGFFEGGSSASRQKIKIQFRDLLFGLDIDQAWRLTKCGPQTRRIDKFDAKIRHRQESPLNIMTELLGFKKNQIPPALNVKLLVVAEKRNSVAQYSKMFIGSVPCASILPAGYYSREDRYESIGEDPFYRDPIVCFVSSMEVAARVANSHPHVKGLLICGDRKLRGNLPYVANLQASGKRTVVLSDIRQFDRANIHRLDSMGFKVTAWTPTTLRKAGVREMSPVTVPSNPLVRAGRILQNVAYGKRESLIVRSAEGDQVGFIRDKLFHILRTTSRTDHMARFTQFVYGLLTQITCMPLPLEQLDRPGYDYKQLIDTMNELIARMYTAVSVDVISLLREIREDTLRCIESHRHYHPKHAVFSKAVDELDDRDCILVRRKRDQSILDDWLTSKGKALRILTLTQALTSGDTVPRCLSLGWYGREHAKLRYSGFCGSESIIQYPFEQSWMGANSRDISAYMKRVSAPSASQSSYQKVQFTSPDLEELIDSLLAEWGRSGEERQSGIPGDLAVADAIAVEFDEECIAFLTSGYNCRCLDEEDEKITQKKVSELEIGDLMVFVKNSAEDIFDKLTDMVKENNSDIREQTDLAALWKRVLVHYIETNRMSFPEFQRLLSMAGVERSVTAIRVWQQEACIGPEDDALIAIAKVVQDPELNDRLKEVLAACRQIRSLHIRLGRYLARAIVSSAAGEQMSEDDWMLQGITQDLSKHAEVVAVRRIGQREVSVPSNKVNRLLDKFYDI